MRQIRVLGVADMTYIGTNQSEYSLVLERSDGQRFMMPVSVSSEAMQSFLQFSYAPEETAAPSPEPQYPEGPQEFESELHLAPKQPVLFQPPADQEEVEVDHSFASLDGDDSDYDEGPLGDIESV